MVLSSIQPQERDFPTVPGKGSPTVKKMCHVCRISLTRMAELLALSESKAEDCLADMVIVPFCHYIGVLIRSEASSIIHSVRL